MWAAEAAFARSGSWREEEDEQEALRWAALQRLPTVARARRGLFRLPAPGDQLQGDDALCEVDVAGLSPGDRTALVDRLLADSGDAEHFFRRIRARFDAVQIEFPKIEVRYEDLTVDAYVHVGSRALPTIPNFICNMTEAFLRHLRIYRGGRVKLPILDNVSGVIRPSRMTLLLGPPSSGKTTLLLALAGRLGPGLKISGNITYNGHHLNEFVPQRTSAYVSQQDWHVSEMTVRETLEFAGRCQGVGIKYGRSLHHNVLGVVPCLLGILLFDTNRSADMLVELLRREKNEGIKPDEDLDVFMKALALEGKQTSLVAEYIMKVCGVSFQLFLLIETKDSSCLANSFNVFCSLKYFRTEIINVKLSEMLLYFPYLAHGSYLSMLKFNLLSLGLPRAFPFCDQLKNFNIFLMSQLLLVALITMTVFFRSTMHHDSVDDGIIYLGALYFAIVMILFNGFTEVSLLVTKLPILYKHRDLHFYPPWAYTLPSWLLSIPTSLIESGMWVLVTYYVVGYDPQFTRQNREMVEILSRPNRESKELTFATKYAQPFCAQYVACLWKQNLSYWRNPQYTAVRFFYTVIISLMFGTICWKFGSRRDTQHDIFNAMGAMYAAVLFIGITNATSVQPVISIERFVSYRERAAGMYSALPFAFSLVTVEFPYILVQSLIYGTIFYSLGSFEWTAVKFLWYLFFMYFTLLYFTFYGMMTTAITPNHTVAPIIAAPFYTLWNLFSGFMIPRKRIPVWWRWYYWANPVSWTLYGLLTSQFGDLEEPLLLADGISSTTAVEFLREHFGFRHDFLGVVAGMVAGFCVLFAVVFALAIKYLNFQRR
ncbi:hypothetical protein ABZP36_027216 [Zizania latifolia]